MAQVNQNKTAEQNLVLQKWTANGYNGTWEAATGCGKTLCGIRAIVNTLKEDPSANAIVVVPTENLRDKEWYNEFVNWGCDQYLDRIEIVCIQTAYKYIDRHYTIGVVDEIHMATSDVYRNLFLNNHFARLFCLTATIEDDDKRIFIEGIAPIIHVTTVERALQLGLISNFTIYNLAVYLSDKSMACYKSIMQKYSEYENLLGGHFRAFGVAAMAMKEIKAIPKEDRTEAQKILYRNACVYWGTMNRRKMFLYNLPEKIQATNDIIKMFPDRKSIVFAESIKFAGELHSALGHSSVIYHSNMSTKLRKQALRAFEIDESGVRTICSVRALNVGFNVPEASLGICASGNSKWLDQVQRNGRVTRYAENKHAIYVNLYAYNTQEVKWVYKRTSKINPLHIRWIFKKEDII